MTTALPYGGGYTCGNCGAWVPPNMFHSCSPSIKWLNPPPPPPPDVLERIAVTLDRIAAALDELLAKEPA